jgi:metal-responsive CopG/Arc/MetJ family transcriptional regulator
MTKIKYSNISIPDKLAHAVDNYIKEHPELDLRSRAQVVSFALRLLLFNEAKNKLKWNKK